MAISYPRDLPLACSIWSATLDLIDNVASSPSGGGKMNLTQVDDPLWRFALRTGTLMPDQAGSWSAWASSLRGGLRTFIASDSRHRAPLAYPSATAPADIAGGWTGTAGVSAVGAGGALTLTGLPVGYMIRAGDRIGVEQGPVLRRGYYKALEDVTSNGGGAATVIVAPFLHTTIFSPGAVARLWRPKAEFVIDWSTWREDEESLPRYASVGFEAWQKL